MEEVKSFQEEIGVIDLLLIWERGWGVGGVEPH